MSLFTRSSPLLFLLSRGQLHYRTCTTLSKHHRLITCKNKDLNLTAAAGGKPKIPESAKFGSLPLASKGWAHRKSKGDFFTLHPFPGAAEAAAEKCVPFSSLGLTEEVVQRVKEGLQIEDLATGFQAKALPQVMRGEHCILAAETGCGKTLAYLLPLLQSVCALKREEQGRRFNTPLALVLTPGRELAAQVGQVSEALGLQTQVIVGGHTKRLLLRPSFEDVDVLVGTVGALSKLITHKIYRVEHVRHVVLDEADTLLDDSFSERLGHLLRRFPFHRGTQLLLVSATLPKDHDELLQPILIPGNALKVVASEDLHLIQRRVPQKFLRLRKMDREAQLLGMVKAEVQKGRQVLVFSNRTPTADFVSLMLNEAGVECLNLTGDMQVVIREGRFARFQSGQCPVLSTTDVGSRGLDTSRVAHVINFDFPLHVADYIHRCGRVGRTGSQQQQQLITHFVSSGREVDLVQRIEHAARTDQQLHGVDANITGIIREQILKNVGQVQAQAQAKQQAVAVE